MYLWDKLGSKNTRANSDQIGANMTKWACIQEDSDRTVKDVKILSDGRYSREIAIQSDGMKSKKQEEPWLPSPSTDKRVAGHD